MYFTNLTKYNRRNRLKIQSSCSIRSFFGPINQFGTLALREEHRGMGAMRSTSKEKENINPNSKIGSGSPN